MKIIKENFERNKDKFEKILFLSENDFDDLKICELFVIWINEISIKYEVDVLEYSLKVDWFGIDENLGDGNFCKVIFLIEGFD